MKAAPIVRLIQGFETQRQAAEALQVSEALISRLLNGTRNVTPKLAERGEVISGGKYRKSALLWGDNEQHSDH